MGTSLTYFRRILWTNCIYSKVVHSEYCGWQIVPFKQKYWGQSALLHKYLGTNCIHLTAMTQVMRESVNITCLIPGWRSKWWRGTGGSAKSPTSCPASFTINLCVCARVCMCVCVCVWVCLCFFLFLCVRPRVRAFLQVCVCAWMCVCVRVCVGVCLAVWMNLIFRRLLMSLKVRFKAKRLSFSCCLLTITVPHHTITLKMFSQTHT